MNIMSADELDQVSINTIRTLSMDAVQQANSGHPGTPMALAPLAYTLWNRVMQFDPQDPIWPNRDRFVLSNGHASMLLWSVLHLTKTQAVNAEYETVGKPSVLLDDIRHFRQIGSKAPDTRNTTSCRALRLPRGRSAKGSPRALAWRSLRSGWPTGIIAMALTFSTIAFLPYAAMVA